MSCPSVRAEFSAHYDDELSMNEKRALEAHFADCSECRREYAEFISTMDGIGPVLRQIADRQRPERPFPEVPPHSVPLGLVLRQLAFALSAAAIALVVVRSLEPAGGVSGIAQRPSSLAHLARPADVEEESCPWLEATPTDLARVISYPVVADDCVEQQFELVQARVQQSEPCPESVELTYRGGDRKLVLEQRIETAPPCCTGEHIPVGDVVVACAEHHVDGTSLRWSQNSHQFHLRGAADLQEAVQFAQDISYRFAP